MRHTIQGEKGLKKCNSCGNYEDEANKLFTKYELYYKCCAAIVSLLYLVVVSKKTTGPSRGKITDAAIMLLRFQAREFTDIVRS